MFYFFVAAFLLLLFILHKYKKISTPLFVILIISFTLRIAFLLLSTKYTGIITFHKDNITFESNAWKIANQANFFNFNTDEIYVIILAFIYKVFGRDYLVASLINIFAALLSGFLIYKTVKENFKNEYYGLIAAVIFLFLPYGFFMSIILLRQSISILFICLWLYYIVRYFNSKKIGCGILSVIFSIVGAAFHSGLIVFTATAILAIFIVEIRTLIKKKNLIRLLALTIITVIIFVAMFMAKDIIMRKFAEKDNLFDSIIYTVKGYTTYQIVNNYPGNSSYLVNFEHTDSNLRFIFYLILKIPYFVFSPMVWDIHRFRDIVGLLGDALFYLVSFSLLAIELIRRIALKKGISIKNTIIFISIVLVTIGFSSVSFNAGTAMRHRLNIFPMLVYALFYSKLFTGFVDKIKRLHIGKNSKLK